MTLAKFAMACLACLPQAPAWAQFGDGLMPEGSMELTVSAALGSGPAQPGSATRSVFLLPQFSAEWSNGVFIEGLAVGMKLSPDPLLQYGPLVSLNLGAQRTDGSRGGVRPVFGAFANVTPFQELTLHAHAVAPAGRDGRGVLLSLNAGTHTVPAPRHVLSGSVGVNLADAGYMRSEFGAGRHRPAGGVRDVFAGARWQWQMSRKFTLTAALQVSVLRGGAAASPRTAQRTGVTNWLALGYSY